MTTSAAKKYEYGEYVLKYLLVIEYEYEYVALASLAGLTTVLIPTRVYTHKLI